MNVTQWCIYKFMDSDLSAANDLHVPKLRGPSLGSRVHSKLPLHPHYQNPGSKLASGQISRLLQSTVLMNADSTVWWIKDTILNIAFCTFHCTRLYRLQKSNWIILINALRQHAVYRYISITSAIFLVRVQIWAPCFFDENRRRLMVETVRDKRLRRPRLAIGLHVVDRKIMTRRSSQVWRRCLSSRLSLKYIRKIGCFDPFPLVCARPLLAYSCLPLRRFGSDKVCLVFFQLSRDMS